MNNLGFLKIPGIDGASTVEGYENWIEVLMVNQMIHRNVNPSKSPDVALTDSQMQIGSIDIQKQVDQSSPDLVSKTCGGKTLGEVKIHLTKSDQDGVKPYYEWSLKDAYLISYSISMTGGNEVSGLENISFGCSVYEWVHTGTPASGKPGTPKRASWDVTKRKLV